MNLVSQIAKLLITMEYYITVSQQERDVERRYKRENPISDLIPNQQVHNGVKNAYHIISLHSYQWYCILIVGL